jgi:hypothetical protein
VTLVEWSLTRHYFVSSWTPRSVRQRLDRSAGMLSQASGAKCTKCKLELLGLIKIVRVFFGRKLNRRRSTPLPRISCRALWVQRTACGFLYGKQHTWTCSVLRGRKSGYPLSKNISKKGPRNCRSLGCAPPGFLLRSVGSSNYMRLSSPKGAHAAVSGAA